MKAFIKFNKGMLKMPLPWQLWLMLLVTVNLVVPLFFLGRLEAQVAIAALLLSMTLMTILTHLAGFTRILGLGHILWLPLLYFLWTRLDLHPPTDFFGIWLRILIGVNTVSLLIDGTDVVRYLAGDREETIKGLSPVGS